MLLSKSTTSKLGNFFGVCEWGPNFKFYWVFCLKGKLSEAKLPTAVLFCDAEGLWNVWTKPESSFPNQLTKNWSICLQLPKRLEISYFIAFFCLKGKFLQPKSLSRVLFSETEGI